MIVCGVDEAGRGPMFGPLVVAGVAKFVEIGIRLMLGLLGHVCARIDRSFEPLFVHCDMHYYRIYVKVKNHPASAGTGYVYLCTHCGNRGVADCTDFSCPYCMKDTETAGPIWIGRLFNGKFTKQMMSRSENLQMDKSCSKILATASSESELPPVYYTLDEVAKKSKTAPPKLADAIGMLQNSGYAAGLTSFDPTGFRTNATFEQITECIL